MTNQPVWKAIANLGDVDPLTYGGAFVLIDITGIYPPELHIYEEPLMDEPTYVRIYEEPPEDELVYMRHVILLDKCTYQNGILSDNRFHPDHPAWWTHQSGERKGFPMLCLCNSMDVSQTELISLFISEDPIERAMAYKMLFDYYGPQSEPDTFSVEEAAPLFNRFLNEIKESRNELHNL